jgi:hypothetical protein
MTTKVRSSVLANTSVVAGTYGSNTDVVVITVDAQGRLTFASQISLSNTFVDANTAQSIFELANTALHLAQTAIDIANTKYDKIGGLISGQIITSDQFMDGGLF